MNTCMCMCARDAGGWILCTIHTMINLPKGNSTHPHLSNFLKLIFYACVYVLCISCSSRTCKYGECGDGDIQDRELDLSERSM